MTDTIDIAAHLNDTAQPAAPAPTTPPPVSPSGPAKQSAVAEDIQTANKVAGIAAVAAEAVAPGITAAPASSTAEATTLSLEDSTAKILSEIPGVQTYSGFMIPAEIATHLIYAFVGLFKHHVATVNQLQKGS